MRWAILIVVAVAAAVLFLVFGDDDDREPDSTSDHQVESAAGTLPPARHDGEAPRAADGHAPALPEGRARVVIDDGPRRPGEEYGRSQRRIAMAQMFETFRREAEVTDEQAQAVLLALYDLQQNSDALMEDATGRRTGDTWRPVLEEYGSVFFARLREILESWQLDVWWEECASCFLYASEGILELQGER